VDGRKLLASPLHLNIDHKQVGIGGTNSWGTRPLPKYEISAKGTYSWPFSLEGR